MAQKRTIVYVDGSNLYYGLLRGTAHKWLDVYAFAKKLLLPEYKICTIKYFASRVIDKSDGHHRAERQDKYLAALSCRGINVIEGYYRSYATFYRNIPPGFADGCMLPESFCTDDGRIIHCPESWK